jgi:predicted AlkP superfamily pyrophosphatase or phosphodiesterase
MTVAVFGIDALDPEITERESHPNLTLSDSKKIDTIVSSTGAPSTHELWPTIFTGLRPPEHGLVLDDGVAWESRALQVGSKLSDYLLPESVQTKLGAWLLNKTSEDAFRVPATYYQKNGISTVFDGIEAAVIGVPNYVIDTESEDREHQLRRQMGELFKRDPGGGGRHTSENAEEFYEQCIEMVMIRTARVRRAVRSRQNELVFGYTSGLDLIGHVSHNRPELQRRAYEETDQFVSELLSDITEDDVLVLISDHGLQEGLHTDEAMIASTDPELITGVSDVTDVREAIETELTDGDHSAGSRWNTRDTTEMDGQVAEQLEDLGYM